MVNCLGNYLPRPVSDADLALMRRMDELEHCCDVLEAQRKLLGGDPATRKTSLKFRELIKELSVILAQRDEVSRK